MARRILIAAGGTGGHIYPALAIAQSFLRREPDCQIEFVGTVTGIENKIVPQNGFKVNHLPIGRLNSNVSLSERIKTVLMLPFAFVKSAQILWHFKPDFVLGVGGHASGPLLLVASFLRYRTAIWEPNAIPGLANRLLARFVDHSFIVFDEAKSHMPGANLQMAGMPVRREIEDMSTQAFKGANGTFHVLVVGGSQGARGINTAVVDMCKLPDFIDISVVHQTGPADFARVKEGHGHNSNVIVREYLNDMPTQYANADLVISRSGTGTLFELAACGKPSILIPLPTAADDHQRRNAESLVKKDAAEMILQKDLGAEVLLKKILALRQNPARLQELARHAREFYQPHAADRLVDQFVNLMD